MPKELLKWSKPKRTRYSEDLRGRGPTGYAYYLTQYGSSWSWQNENGSHTGACETLAGAKVACENAELARLRRPGDANSRRAVAKLKAKGVLPRTGSSAKRKSIATAVTKKQLADVERRAAKAVKEIRAKESLTLKPWMKDLPPNASLVAGYKAHPAAAEMPLLSEPELTELAASIKRNGLRQPVVLHDGLVVDGRNRLLACEIAGVKARTTELEGDQVVELVADANLRRRHLTQDQRAAIAAKLVRHYKAEAKKAPGSHKAKGGKPAPGAGNPPKTVPAAAESYGVGARTIERAAAVEKKSPELAKKVLAGEATLKQAEKQLRHADQVKKVKAYVPPAGKYSVIVADFPWRFDDELGGSENSRGAVPYPTMSIEEVCAFEMPAADDCVLFLWAPNALVADGTAAKVLAAHGFAGKTIITWDKELLGIGRWIRNQTEQCIVAVKGKPTVTLTAQSSLLRAKRGSHSEKPDELFALVESLCPATSRLELFARKARPGWVTSGAEAPASSFSSSTESAKQEPPAPAGKIACACKGFEPAVSSTNPTCVCGHSVEEHAKDAGACNHVARAKEFGYARELNAAGFRVNEKRGEINCVVCAQWWPLVMPLARMTRPMFDAFMQHANEHPIQGSEATHARATEPKRGLFGPEGTHTKRVQLPTPAKQAEQFFFARCSVAGCQSDAAMGEEKCAKHLVEEDDAAEAKEKANVNTVTGRPRRIKEAS